MLSPLGLGLGFSLIVPFVVVFFADFGEVLEELRRLVLVLRVVTSVVQAPVCLLLLFL